MNFEKAIAEIKSADNTLPFKSIAYLRGDLSLDEESKLIEEVKYALKNWSKIDDDSPLYLVLAGQKHLSKDYALLIINIFSHECDYDCFLEECATLLEMLSIEYPEEISLMVLKAAEFLVAKESRAPFLYMFDILRYINVDLYKDRLIKLCDKKKNHWFLPYTTTLSQLGISDGLDLLKTYKNIELLEMGCNENELAYIEECFNSIKSGKKKPTDFSTLHENPVEIWKKKYSNIYKADDSNNDQEGTIDNNVAMSLQIAANAAESIARFKDLLKESGIDKHVSYDVFENLLWQHDYIFIDHVVFEIFLSWYDRTNIKLNTKKVNEILETLSDFSNNVERNGLQGCSRNTVFYKINYDYDDTWEKEIMKRLKKLKANKRRKPVSLEQDFSFILPNKIEMINLGNGKWKFKLTGKFLDYYFKMLDTQELPENKQRKVYKQMIDVYPEFFYAYSGLSSIQFGDDNYEMAEQMMEKGMSHLKKIFDNYNFDFTLSDARLENSYIENRPILDFLFDYACHKELESGVESAVFYYNTLLKLDPQDSRDMRSRLADFYLKSNLDNEFMKLFEKYKSDKPTPQLIVGRLFQMVKNKEYVSAKKYYRKIKNQYIHIIYTILGDDLPMDYSYGDNFGFQDSKEEAANYYADNKTLWDKTPGAIEFLQGLVN